MALIPKTADQLRELAKQALKAKRARAHIKASIKAGRITLAEVLDLGKMNAGDTIIGRMRIGQVLDAVPGMGPVHVTTLLEELDLDANTHLDRLTQYQRDLIIMLRVP